MLGEGYGEGRIRKDYVVVQFVFGKAEKNNHKHSPKQEGNDFWLLFKELWNGWKVENEGNGKKDKILIKGIGMGDSLPCVSHYVFINEKLLKVCPAKVVEHKIIPASSH
jgi:hypothetical protein